MTEQEYLDYWRESADRVIDALIQATKEMEGN